MKTLLLMSLVGFALYLSTKLETAHRAQGILAFRPAVLRATSASRPILTSSDDATGTVLVQFVECLPLASLRCARNLREGSEEVKAKDLLALHIFSLPTLGARQGAPASSQSWPSLGRRMGLVLIRVEERHR